MVPTFALAGGGAQKVKVVNEPTIQKVKKPVKLDATVNVPQQGLFGTREIDNAIRNQQVPGALLGGGDCKVPTDPQDPTDLGNAQPSDVTINPDGGRTVITAILISGR